MGPWFGVEVALAAALEHIPTPAFVVSATGSVLRSNRVGTAWLTTPENRELLMRRDPAVFDVTPFAFGATTHFLAIRRAPCPAESLAARWKLTPREAEVTAAILRGATNQQIAAELGCAVKTVEHHVSSILRKANLDNRASLIIAILEA